MEKGERGEGVFVRVCHSIINFSTEFLCDGHKRKKASDTYLGASTVAPAAAVCLFFIQCVDLTKDSSPWVHTSNCISRAE